MARETCPTTTRRRRLWISAFIRHLFGKADIDLAPGVHGKNTTPEDISRTAVPHITYLLQREVAQSRLAGLRRKLHGRVRERIEKIKEARRKSTS